MRKIYIAILVFVLTGLASIAQVTDDSYGPFSAGPPLNGYDSIHLMSLPELELPPATRGTTLPPVVDNSTLPYLRPVFSQQGASCGQAAAVGYNFTYEIDHARELPADTTINQYPTHFTWNFMNGGNGWYGVSYFHSFEVLRLCGNMNVEDYGGYYYDDGRRWISGYDVYYNGMSNRINQAYNIKTDTEEGILTLKHWLFNHLGESGEGGVASYYANVPYNAVLLNDTTPEGGKYVVTAWWLGATHAMTIVGYNDSIRWDYNLDGQYTNNLDLNGDGTIDPRDWEIGGVRFVNSHGYTNDSGFCYMMYKVLAESFENGGIWNNAVQVLDIRENYTPQLTFKIILRHNYREKIRVMAGVSSDTADAAPAVIMDFPIFNYQGADHFMQGQDTAEYLQYIEFGLDVTPLLSHITPGQPAGFFLIVDENDPNNEGEGEVTAFSLMDYTTAPAENVCPAAPLPLAPDSRTLLKIIHTPEFEKVSITTDALPAYQEGEAYSHQLAATGGQAPYHWSLDKKYTVTEGSDSLSPANEWMLMPNASEDTLVAVPLEFSFPFYGVNYDTVYAHVDGYIQFVPEWLPWPYILDQALLLKSNRIIAPYTHSELSMYRPEGDGVWYEGDSAQAVFRWKVSWLGNQPGTEFNFSLKITPGGEIEFSYGEMQNEWIYGVSGISDGDKESFKLTERPLSLSFLEGTSLHFIPQWFPPGMELLTDGLFTGIPSDEGRIYDISFRVTDNQDISTTRTLQFTTGPMISLVPDNGPEGILEYGDTVNFTLTVKNSGNQAISGCTIQMMEEDPYVELSGGSALLGDIAPGDSVIIPAAFSFIVSRDVPDLHFISSMAILQGSGTTWQKSFLFTAWAPDLRVDLVEVNDGNDGILDPGETAELLVTTRNDGHAAIHDVAAELGSPDPGITVNGNPIQFPGDFQRGQAKESAFQVEVDISLPAGWTSRFDMEYTAAEEVSSVDSFNLRIGRIPVLVIDLDPFKASGPGIESVLTQMGVIHDYYEMIPGNLNQYQSAFICLGTFFNYHELSWYEGDLLAGYLDNGGRIYLESRKTWKDDPQTPLQPYFRIVPEGLVTTFDTIQGVAGTFTAGHKFFNGAAYPLNFYYLAPAETAFSILQDNLNLKSCAVAFENSTYRTIGTIFEFGTLQQVIPSSTLQGLMADILDFFEVMYIPVGMNEHPPALNLAVLKVFPNPSRGQVTFQFELAEPTVLAIDIHRLDGRHISTVCNRRYFPSGHHALQWDGNGRITPGIYVIRLSGDKILSTGRLIFTR